MTDTIHIDKYGHRRIEAIQQVEEMARSSGLDPKTEKRLRLVTEETIEMVHAIADEFEADFSCSIHRGNFTIHLVVDTSMNPEKRSRLLSAAGREKGITGKIRSMLVSKYPKEEEKKALEEAGISYLSSKDMDEVDHPDKEEGYVWSLQTHEMSVVNDLVEDKDVDWTEIGRSIIANLADDVRVYIFHDSVEIYVTKALVETGKPKVSRYPIDSELDTLRKVPVPMNRFEIKLVQLMYNRLIRKETSSDGIRLEKNRMPSEASPTGSLTVLSYVSDKAKMNETLPCVFLLHGGAFLFPAMPYHYRMARQIAKEIRCRVIMPMYDLGPKYVAPTSQFEMADIYGHVVKNAAGYHIDPERIALIGDSAGGTLVAALTLLIRERGLKQPAGQALLYPSLDRRLITESMKKYTDVPVCNGASIREYYKICRADEYDDKIEYLSPMEAESLAGLPDAYVETAEFDALHDEGIAYADRLAKEGVNVIVNETSGTVHAFDMAKDSRAVKEAMKHRIAFLKQVLV